MSKLRLPNTETTLFIKKYTGIDASLIPLLALLVDQHCPGQYGAAYAIGQSAICLGFALGIQYYFVHV